jgi:thymidylate synthase
MKSYLSLMKDILDNGIERGDRTGVGTKALFAQQLRFDLSESFPAVTTKKLAFRSVVSELLWMLEGSTDERRLAEIHFGKDRINLEFKNTIWTANADTQGVYLGYSNNIMHKELGPVYGAQWRSWGAANGVIDQIADVIYDLENNPDSRRHIVSAWNVGELDKMALPPCHCLFQFFVAEGKLHCHLYQRSCDMFLGVPFNIASYSLLTHMIAQIVGLGVGEFIWTGGDCHIYNNHVEQAKEQLSRSPKSAPTLTMPEFTTLEELLEYKPEDFILNDYDPYETIKADMAV